MIAVTGACMVLSTLPGLSAGRSRSLASGDFTKSTRIGLQLALVGPNAAISYAWRSSASGTGRASQARWVRALRKMRSRPSSPSMPGSIAGRPGGVKRALDGRDIRPVVLCPFSHQSHRHDLEGGRPMARKPADMTTKYLLTEKE